MLRVCGCVFCSLPLVFLHLRMRMSSHPRSIAGVPFDSVGRPWTILLLRTTCMRSCCNWSASCLAALQTKNQKSHGIARLFHYKFVPGVSRSPQYCAPLVCDLNFSGGSAVWRLSLETNIHVNPLT